MLCRQRDHSGDSQQSAARLHSAGLPIAWVFALRHSRQHSHPASQASSAQQQPFKAGAVSSAGNINRRLTDAREEVLRRPEQGSRIIFKFTNLATGRSSIPATIGTSGRVGVPRKRQSEWNHAVLMQRMLGFSSRARGFLHKRPAVQWLLKAPAEPDEGNPTPARQPTIPASHACQS